MLVVDASALVLAVADSTEIGRQRRSRLSGENISVPDLVLTESASAIRRQTFVGMIDEVQANQAIEYLV